jgi:predicted transcriptional regulator
MRSINKESKKQFIKMLKNAEGYEQKIEQEIEKLEQEMKQLVQARLATLKDEYNQQLQEIKDFVQTDVIDEIEACDNVTPRMEEWCEEWTYYMEEELEELEEIEFDICISQYSEFVAPDSLQRTRA